MSLPHPPWDPASPPPHPRLTLHGTQPHPHGTPTRMTWQDFLEALVRLATMMAFPTQIEIDAVHARHAGEYLHAMQVIHHPSPPRVPSH
jgi:hypothetical protein